jgi:hypothetical protein
VLILLLLIWFTNRVCVLYWYVQEKYSLADIAATFGATLPGTLTLHNYPL